MLLITIVPFNECYWRKSRIHTRLYMLEKKKSAWRRIFVSGASLAHWSWRLRNLKRLNKPTPGVDVATLSRNGNFAELFSRHTVIWHRELDCVVSFWAFIFSCWEEKLTKTCHTYTRTIFKTCQMRSPYIIIITTMLYGISNYSIATPDGYDDPRCSLISI